MKSVCVCAVDLFAVIGLCLVFRLCLGSHRLSCDRVLWGLHQCDSLYSESRDPKTADPRSIENSRHLSPQSYVKP